MRSEDLNYKQLVWSRESCRELKNIDIHLSSLIMRKVNWSNKHKKAAFFSSTVIYLWVHLGNVMCTLNFWQVSFTVCLSLTHSHAFGQGHMHHTLQQGNWSRCVS